MGIIVQIKCNTMQYCANQMQYNAILYNCKTGMIPKDLVDDHLQICYIDMLSRLVFSRRAVIMYFFSTIML